MEDMDLAIHTKYARLEICENELEVIMNDLL
jgi:hypothetical protein